MRVQSLIAIGSDVSSLIGKLSFGQISLTTTTLEGCIFDSSLNYSDASSSVGLLELALSVQYVGLTTPYSECQFSADAFDHIFIFTRSHDNGLKQHVLQPYSLDHAYAWLSVMQSNVYVPISLVYTSQPKQHKRLLTHAPPWRNMLRLQDEPIRRHGDSRCHS
jgi:hypothetical protein